MGATIPAAVMMATVAEPCATRMAAAITQATMSGEIDDVISNWPAYWPTPESTITCLNAPPPPMMHSNAPMGASDCAAIFAAPSRVTPRRMPNQ
jgi:hypothetical protein